jgi:hypothetical protein
MKLKKYEEFINESVNESVWTIAGGIILGIIGLKAIKWIFKKVLGKISMNVPLPKEKLHEILDEIKKEALIKDSSQLIKLMPYFSSIKELIDDGDITTAKELLKVFDKSAEMSKDNIN